MIEASDPALAIWIVLQMIVRHASVYPPEQPRSHCVGRSADLEDESAPPITTAENEPQPQQLD